MKKKGTAIYLVCCIVLFLFSLKMNADYFYRLAYDNLILYQLKQVGSLLVLYSIGYLFLKAVQNYFNDTWVYLLSMPCGIALWVFAGQFLLMSHITYTMYGCFLLIGGILAAGYLLRYKKRIPVKGNRIPTPATICIIVGTAFLVSTGWNYINMNYDSYLYFANYGKVIANLGDYREWNTSNAFVITNIGQFLATLNSYTAFWGLDYCLSIQSFMTLNMFTIFGYAVYDLLPSEWGKKKSLWYTILFTAVMATCTSVVVYANWLLSNAFIMYYMLIAGILGMKAPKKVQLDYMLVLSGCALSITMLRKDGIILACFLFICYCCNQLMDRKKLVLLFLPSLAAQLYYIVYVRLYLKADVHTARGTSLLNNTFVIMLIAAAVLTMIYILFLHKWFEKWFQQYFYTIVLIIMLAAVIGAILIKLSRSIDHIDAVFHVLVSPAYGFSLLNWLFLLAVVMARRIEIDYGIFFIFGYCMLTFLIYWNKGNTDVGIDNSGMRNFVQIVPMIYYIGAAKIKEIFNRQE